MVKLGKQDGSLIEHHKISLFPEKLIYKDHSKGASDRKPGSKT
jgi:hypothetical protein